LALGLAIFSIIVVFVFVVFVVVGGDCCGGGGGCVVVVFVVSRFIPAVMSFFILNILLSNPL
jgi:hypothetical protein